MKTKIAVFSIALLMTGFASAQLPKLYINFVSHNEPGDNLQQAINFNHTVPWVLQFADLMDSKGASWNLETCNGFVNGALSIQNAGTLSTDILETLANPPYDDNLQIDPRNKNLPGTNVADLWHLLDSCGANPSRNLGGFIYASTQTGIYPDWFQYEDTLWGLTYSHVPWKCLNIWGAGSIPPHNDDLNDYGIWKPDSVNTFYTHNPARSIWYQGNGCQPVMGLDSIEDEQVVIAQIKGAVDSIQNGLWPNNKFYCYTVTYNQSQLGPMLFQKVSNVIDSVNAIGADKIVWATISEKFDTFQLWQSNPNDYSQWNCGDVLSGMEDAHAGTAAFVAPNPFSGSIKFSFADGFKHEISVLDGTGRLVGRESVVESNEISTEAWPRGLYLITMDGQKTLRMVKD